METATTTDSSRHKRMILSFDANVPVIDVSSDKDGVVYKVIRKPGEGDEMPEQGDHVYIKYAQTEIFAEDLLTSFLKGHKFDFTLGINNVMTGLDMGVASMKKGEKAILFLHPRHAMGKELTFDPPICIPVVFYVELKSWKKLPPMSEAGNLDEKDDKDETKIRVYKKLINRLTELELADGQGEKTTLMLAGYLKIANCYMKLGKFESVLEYCSKVLEVDDRNFNGLHRTAQALLALGNGDASKEYYRKFMDINPNAVEELSPMELLFLEE